MNSSIRPRILPLNLDTAAYVDPERTHLPNRGANVLRIEPAPQQDRDGGANLFGQPPIGTRSAPARVPSPYSRQPGFLRGDSG